MPLLHRHIIFINSSIVIGLCSVMNRSLWNIVVYFVERSSKNPQGCSILESLLVCRRELSIYWWICVQDPDPLSTEIVIVGLFKKMYLSCFIVLLTVVPLWFFVSISMGGSCIFAKLIIIICILETYKLATRACVNKFCICSAFSF